MDIEFRKITKFGRGTLAELLRDGYSSEAKFERDWHEQWQELDDGNEACNKKKEWR